MMIMQKKSSKRNAIVFTSLLVILVSFLVANLCIGNVKMSVKDVFGVLFTGSGDEKLRSIIFNIRLPRTIMATILGGALAVSGFLLQTYFSNPIAGPYILGVSSGARMMVALLLVFVAGGITVKGYMLVLAAFAGALVVVFAAVFAAGFAAAFTTGFVAVFALAVVLPVVVVFFAVVVFDADVFDFAASSAACIAAIRA